MSGILGIINSDGTPVDCELFQRQTNFMSYRGPHSQRVWIDRDVGLAHTLLLTAHEAETETQPTTLEGKVWLIADARIDARSELLKKLASTLAPKRNPNDAELILYAYKAWGEECVNHLIGDFVFVIWDTRSRRLFCVRDHLGVKPFFYSQVSNSFVFSNTLNALRLDRRVSDDLNEVAIGDYLLFGLNQDLSTTTFRDIRRLPAGHTLTVSNGNVKTHCYWRPTKKPELHFRNQQSYVERFDELLSSAVGDRLRTDRVAISMSGGLDSTSIAAVSRELMENGNALHAFSVVYDRLIPDQERYYSQTAADHIGLPITHINADHFSLFDGQTSDETIQAEPFLISPLSGQFNTLLRLCAGHGCVALTGWDGDALMNESANNYFASAVRALRLKQLTFALAWYVKTQRRTPGFGFRGRLKRAFGKNNVPGFYPEWFDESFAARTNLRERAKESLSTQDSSVIQALASKVWSSLFEGYDPGATRIALELRHPFIDLRLIEFLLSVPAVPWCVEKHILRRAMQARLPATILNRRKTPLGGDPALQMTRRASVRWLDSFEVSPQLRCFVNLDKRRSIVDEHTPDALWASLRVYALNYWLSKFQSIDRAAVRTRLDSVQPITATSKA